VVALSPEQGDHLAKDADMALVAQRAQNLAPHDLSEALGIRPAIEKEPGEGFASIQTEVGAIPARVAHIYPRSFQPIFEASPVGASCDHKADVHSVQPGLHVCPERIEEEGIRLLELHYVLASTQGDPLDRGREPTPQGASDRGLLGRVVSLVDGGGHGQCSSLAVSLGRKTRSAHLCIQLCIRSEHQGKSGWVQALLPRPVASGDL